MLRKSLMAGVGLAGAVALCLGAAAGAGQAQTIGGKPDFTGVWTSYRDPAAPARAGRAAAPAAPAAAAPANGAGTAAPARAGRGSPALPLKPEIQARIAEYRKLIGDDGDSPQVWCAGYSMPAAMLGSGGYPMDIVQHPTVIHVTYEALAEHRWIYLGNKIIPEKDRVPTRDGTSSARWEGDVLVVETTDLKDNIDSRFPHSENAKVIERYSVSKDSTGRRVLTAQMTMTDPDFYTQPVVQEKKWSELVGGHVMPYDCAEQLWDDHLEQLRNPNAPTAKYY